VPVKWRRAWIADESYESAGVFDVDGDGVPDIVSGAFWYRGPDFRKKIPVGPVAREGEYWDDFSTIAMDVNGDGKLDFVTGGWWGNTIRWRENPGDPKKEWPVHVIAEVGNVETTRAWDIDGCGVPEIVPNTPNASEVAVWKLVGPGRFEKHVVHRFTGEQKQGHGLGCGDVAGNRRMDLVTNRGWLEAPRDTWNGAWRWHEGPAVATASTGGHATGQGSGAGTRSIPTTPSSTTCSGLTSTATGSANWSLASATAPTTATRRGSGTTSVSTTSSGTARASPRT
jgi:hypothetical protein